MSDPVAEKSGFLKMYMSSHPDTLVGYAKWYGKVSEPITSAEMSAIDTKSMTLTCTLKNGTKKVVVVTIDPPLAGYEDVKPRLLEMKAISQEGLGMVRKPCIYATSVNPLLHTDQIPPNNFVPPPTARNLGYYFVFSLVPYGAFAPSYGESPFLIPAQFLHSYVSPKVFKITFAIAFGIHLLEGLYTLSLCRKHKASFRVTAAYCIATWFIGFHVWKDLRKRIQNARIESVMKVE